MTAREKSLEFLKQAIELAKAGHKKQARPLLLSATAQDPGNEMAWLWLASVSDTPGEARTCLEQALSLNPSNSGAVAWLERLEAQMRAAREAEQLAEVSQDEASKDEVSQDEVSKDGSPRTEADEASQGAPVALGYLDLERFGEAVSYLKAAADLQPENPRLQKLVEDLTHRLDHAGAASRAEPSGGQEEPASQVAALGPWRGIAGRTVLVADGDRRARLLVAQTLGEHWQVLQATNGLEAMARLEQTVPDLIFVAADLRRVDGGRICGLVKGNDLTRDVPVVLLYPAGAPRGSLPGAERADLVLGKPLDSSRILGALMRFFGRPASS